MQSLQSSKGHLREEYHTAGAQETDADLHACQGSQGDVIGPGAHAGVQERKQAQDFVLDVTCDLLIFLPNSHMGHQNFPFYYFAR